MSNYHWDTYAVCSCGYKTHAWQANVFFVREEVCPSCGRNKNTFQMQTLKKVSTAIWWKPWTWFSGYWINKANIDKLESLISPKT